MTEDQWLVQNKHGEMYGPFPTAKEAAEYAQRKWPDQEQGPNGWDVAVLHAPDEP